MSIATSPSNFSDQQMQGLYRERRCTEKATDEYAAPCDGVMLEHLAEEGDDVPVGEEVCRIDKRG